VGEPGHPAATGRCRVPDRAAAQDDDTTETPGGRSGWSALRTARRWCSRASWRIRAERSHGAGKLVIVAPNGEDQARELTDQIMREVPPDAVVVTGRAWRALTGAFLTATVHAHASATAAVRYPPPFTVSLLTS
jgi:hypothetical protein